MLQFLNYSYLIHDRFQFINYHLSRPIMRYHQQIEDYTTSIIFIDIIHFHIGQSKYAIR